MYLWRFKFFFKAFFCLCIFFLKSFYLVFSFFLVLVFFFTLFIFFCLYCGLIIIRKQSEITEKITAKSKSFFKTQPKIEQSQSSNFFYPQIKDKLNAEDQINSNKTIFLTESKKETFQCILQDQYLDESYKDGFWIYTETYNGSDHWKFFFKHAETALIYKTVATQTIPTSESFKEKDVVWWKAPINNTLVTSEKIKEFKEDKFKFSKNTLNKIGIPRKDYFNQIEVTKITDISKNKFSQGKISAVDHANILKIQWFCTSIVSKHEIEYINSKLLNEATIVQKDLPDKLKSKLGYDPIYYDENKQLYNSSIKNNVDSFIIGDGLKGGINFDENFLKFIA